MNKDLKNGVKKLLLMDTLLSSADSLSRIFDEVETELEEIFGGAEKNNLKLEELLKNKNLK